MKVKELKELLKEVPDDIDIIILYNICVMVNHEKIVTEEVSDVFNIDYNCNKLRIFN